MNFHKKALAFELLPAGKFEIYFKIQKWIFLNFFCFQNQNNSQIATTTFLLGVVFLLPVSVIIHDFWEINDENDFLRKSVLQTEKGQLVVKGGASSGSRQFPTFTSGNVDLCNSFCSAKAQNFSNWCLTRSDFDADFVPFIKNLQVAAALYFYWQTASQK